MTPRAAYVHIPFCAHRCGYCNFTVIAGRDELADVYLDALTRELQQLEQPRLVETLFVGGGTPTRLRPFQLRRLCDLLDHWFPRTTHYEYTFEANPGDLDERSAGLLEEAGVNRISLGAQSFQPDKLRALDRQHSADDVHRSLELIRRHVRSVSVDLIFAAPGETLAMWLHDLREVLRYAPDHLSTYGLTVEQGTLFWNARQKQQWQEVDEESQRQMYLAAIREITAGNLEHYEVSNFSLPGHRCHHNEVYWTGRRYFGVGAGASRFVANRRETNHRSTTTYIKRLLAKQTATAESEELDVATRARERMVFGLRRLQGIDLAALSAELEIDAAHMFQRPLQKYVELGMLDHDGANVQLTPDGLLVSDSMWPDFLASS